MVLKRLFASIVILTVVINLILLYNKDRTENVIQQGYEMKKEDNLISREILFGNPDRVFTRINKDGKFLSYIAPKDGVLNIWVAPIDKISEAKVITNEKQRGIRSYFWANDNTHIIYAQDKKGDENWRLYSVNVLNEKQKDLTPSDGVRASVLKLSDKYPNEILILINDRVPEYFDIYRVDINTGKRELVYENTAKYSSFCADDDFKNTSWLQNASKRRGRNLFV